jgi:hypothetical protein
VNGANIYRSWINGFRITIPDGWSIGKGMCHKEMKNNKGESLLKPSPILFILRESLNYSY